MRLEVAFEFGQQIAAHHQQQAREHHFLERQLRENFSDTANSLAHVVEAFMHGLHFTKE